MKIQIGLMEFMSPAERNNLYRAQKVVLENDKFKFIEPIMCRLKNRNLTKAGFLRLASMEEIGTFASSLSHMAEELQTLGNQSGF